MKKSMIAVFTAAVLMISLCACGTKSEHDNYKEIYKRYFDMETFAATVEVAVKTEKTESVFCAKQYYAAPDKFSMIVTEPQDFAGSGYVFEKDSVTLKSGFAHSERLDGISVENRGSVAISDFFAEYYKSEEIRIETAKGIATDETRLDCFCSGKNEKRYMQSLWIDNKTYLPIKMITYDLNEQPVVTVTFKEFERNCKLEMT